MRSTPDEKTVYIPMCADVVHAGHLNVIKQGAKRGNVVIGLLTDSAVAEKKRLPFMSYDQRYEVINSIKGVDRVIPQNTPNYLPNLLKLKPDFVIHGDDWNSRSKQQVVDALNQWGGKLVELKYTENISSTLIQKRLKSRGVLPVYRLGLLKRLLESKQTIRALEAHDGLSALTVEGANYVDDNGHHQVFDAVWVSSLTGSLTRGKPDTELIDRSTRLATIGDILDVSTKPLIVDADTGGQPDHFAYMVRKLEEMGVSAVVIEDKTGQKRNSLYGTPKDHVQENIEIFADKIRTGVNARLNDDFLIIARIESLILGKGINDAITRAKAFLKAGADALVIHSKQSDASDVFEFARTYNQLPERKPLVFIPTSYPKFTEAELASHGANIIIYANHLLRAAYPAMQQAAQSILTNSRTYEAEKHITSIEQLLKILPNEQ